MMWISNPILITFSAPVPTDIKIPQRRVDYNGNNHEHKQLEKEMNVPKTKNWLKLALGCYW